MTINPRKPEKEVTYCGFTMPEKRLKLIQTIALMRRPEKVGMSREEYLSEYDRPQPICDLYLHKPDCDGCPFVKKFGIQCYSDELEFDPNQEDVWCEILEDEYGLAK